MDITGKRFGRLCVVERSEVVGKNAKFRCRCDCGKEKIVWRFNLTTGATTSCGCYHTELMTRHGEAGRGRTRTYQIWAGMMDRCEWGGNPKAWKHYGARGIRVCERWHDYRLFLADMGAVPHGRSIDRINNDGNYEPSNCRWATVKEQALNTSRTRKVRYQGQIIPAMELSGMLGISHKAIRSRAVRRANDYVAAFRSVGVQVDVP